MASEEEEATAATRAKVREALGVVEPHPGLRSRVIASTPVVHEQQQVQQQKAEEPDDES